MQIILLSGGSGQRLWPLSNGVRSKQFIKFLRSADGSYCSMLQNVYSKLKSLNKEIQLTVTTSKNQVSAIHNQIGTDVSVCVEPTRKDTFPAILLASLFLRDVKKVDLDEPVVICPVDPYVDEKFFVSLMDLGKLVESNKANLSLLGIEPTYPSEKYGYIIPNSTQKISDVLMFKEKPNEATARKYLKQGALWNGGVFAFKLRYLIEKAHEAVNFEDYYDLYKNYDKLDKISFDYAIAEKEKKIQVMRYVGEWKDLGTWNTLTESMPEHIIGKGILDEKCKNTHILNELDIPVLGLGLKNLIVAASPQGILVSDKEESAHIKPFVEKMSQRIMFAEKSWGKYQVLNVSDNSLTVLISLKKGQEMTYHSHDRRQEVWTITSGKGIAVLDGIPQPVEAGDIISIDAGCKHTLIADTELKAIEVQLGKDISVHDKHKYQLEKSR
ncbi:sugar phosphate nucleotidyltransferase [Liquorilactobacillus satsumensis]|uniref:sugar phosphate nucleotidyltransferase n=1 Tax=Liquorilactobacillus satsumensis TaxID=259059 RepID=UPI0039EC6481